MQDQNHPLYSTDRENIDNLLAKDVPEQKDLIDLARLLIRYEGFPGANDLQEDMHKILRVWKLSRDELNNLTRNIWEAGYLPGKESATEVGSGFDTSDSDSD